MSSSVEQRDRRRKERKAAVRARRCPTRSGRRVRARARAPRAGSGGAEALPAAPALARSPSPARGGRAGWSRGGEAAARGARSARPGGGGGSAGARAAAGGGSSARWPRTVRAQSGLTPRDPGDPPGSQVSRLKRSARGEDLSRTCCAKALKTQRTCPGYAMWNNWLKVILIRVPGGNRFSPRLCASPGPSISFKIYLPLRPHTVKRK
ncbi:atherin-like [Dasypus novemcinctus]|uniref:atherin-like n=1 Tax=Dasypus novemcinctus TaxID=9361 RepID=UPI0039C9C494